MGTSSSDWNLSRYHYLTLECPFSGGARLALIVPCYILDTMNRSNPLLSLISAFTSIFLLLCVTSCSKKAEGPATRAGGGAVPVEVLVVQSQYLENRAFATGTLMANEEVELRSEISGRLVGVFFEEGRAVRKGDLLMRVNDRDLKAQYTRKELEEKLAADEEHRKRQLFDIKGISQEEYDRTLNTLKLIQAEKEEIGAQLAKTEILAPFSGVVGLRYVSEGGYVSPNMLAATIQEINPMKVEFSVPEKYAPLVRSGQKIKVQVGGNEIAHEGVVYAVESKIDLGTRTIKARAKTPNSNKELVPGAFARVEITLEQIPDAIVIPAAAIIPEMSGDKVLVCRDGKAASVRVTTGIRTDRNIQIVSGLAPSDTLILTGLLQLTDGRAVKITTVREATTTAK
jgi:membrane fusion protein, multidrug efflux system